MGGAAPGQPSPGGAINPPPAALGRHTSKHRKHQSAGPLPGPGMGSSPQTGPGSTGLLVGSSRPSRAISPLQTQTQGSGAAGNLILMPSGTGGLPSAQPSPINGPAQPQHPYATGAGMQTPAPYARAEYANGGRQSPNGVYGGGIPGGSGMLAQSQHRSSVPGAGQPGVGPRQASWTSPCTGLWMLTFMMAFRSRCNKDYRRNAAYLRLRRSPPSWTSCAVAAGEKGGPPRHTVLIICTRLASPISPLVQIVACT